LDSKLKFKTKNKNFSKKLEEYQKYFNKRFGKWNFNEFIW
jgi:hypothetical protein